MQILILGATGILGQPVTRCLMDKGHRVRVLTRSPEKACRMFGNRAEIVEGSAVDWDSIRTALTGCDAVHVNLTQEAELTATQLVVDQVADNNLERISYVSATTACEENRWFEMVDVKMQTEEILRRSGIAHTVFCPTWVMEVLHNFVHGNRAAVIFGQRPPALHFFAAADCGRMVATAYDDVCSRFTLAQTPTCSYTACPSACGAMLISACSSGRAINNSNQEVKA